MWSHSNPLCNKVAIDRSIICMIFCQIMTETVGHETEFLDICHQVDYAAFIHATEVCKLERCAQCQLHPLSATSNCLVYQEHGKTKTEMCDIYPTQSIATCGSNDSFQQWSMLIHDEIGSCAWRHREPDFVAGSRCIDLQISSLRINAMYPIRAINHTWT